MTENDVKAALRTVLKRNNNHGIYVNGIGKSEFGESCCFSAVIQDVARFSDLDPLSIRRQLSWGEIGHVTVNFIEVSFDVFCNDPAEQGARFYLDLINPVSNNCRLYRNGKGTPKQIPHDINEIKRHLLDGWQIGIGDRVEKDPNTKYQHIYVKDTDTINGQRQAVERRARIEITLAGDSLPSRDWADWQRFPFEQLAPYFRRRRERPDVTDADVLKEIERKILTDEDDPVQRRSYTHQADPINRGVYNALRELSRRWQTAGRRGRPSTSKQKRPDKLLRGNYPVSDCFVSAQPLSSNNYIKGENSFHSKAHNEPPQQETAESNRTPAADASLQSQSDDQSRGAETATPNNRPSNGPAKIIARDETGNSVLDDLMALYDQTPTAMEEQQRIDALMSECGCSDAPSPKTSKS